MRNTAYPTICLLAALAFFNSGQLLAQDPVLPSTPHTYSDMSVLPLHFTDPMYPFGAIATSDNEPVDNMVTDAGATLGRVLFYDKRLSANDSVSCASCHRQENGFSDPNVFSIGFDGGLTGRHSMGLANTRYYANGNMFWDERAGTLEEQVLLPIQDPVEMGMTLTALEAKIAATAFYGPLFEDAFGDDMVTSNRISRALAQFVRSLISYESKFDEALQAGNYPNPNFPAVFTAQELMGLALYQPMPGGQRTLGCDRCHGSATQTMGKGAQGPGNGPPGPFATNNGLDANTNNDQGAGNGRFKAPSLRNIEVRPPYMHDGRFSTLEEVVEFYNSGIQNHPFLDPGLRRPNGQPVRFNMSQAEKDALVAFLKTLTDPNFLTKEEFSNPFPSLVMPTDFSLPSGALLGGTLADLFDSDNSKVRVRGVLGPAAAIQVTSTSPTAEPTYLAFTSECSTRSNNANQEIHLFNYVTGEYELLDEQSARLLGDKIVTIEATGDLSRFVDPNTLEMDARVVIRRPTLTRGLFGYFDRAFWTVR